jgi:hypothetical protein
MISLQNSGLLEDINYLSNARERKCLSKANIVEVSKHPPNPTPALPCPALPKKKGGKR